MRILLLSDIHGNFPALEAVARFLPAQDFDLILNCGDSTVYAPFANQVLAWLRRHQALSILGNTDRKILKLLKGKSFRKPSRPDKRIMYTDTASVLSKKNRHFLKGLEKKTMLTIEGCRILLCHGSPEDNDEFLFPSTPQTRFEELAAATKAEIVVSGHSHTPYVREAAGTLFINPGSIGRMFDGDPRASCAILETTPRISVHHLRLAYDIEAVIRELRRRNLPTIYDRMYRLGRKLN